MEYANWGSLYNYIRRKKYLNEEESFKYFSQIIIPASLKLSISIPSVLLLLTHSNNTLETSFNLFLSFNISFTSFFISFNFKL